MSTWRVRHEGAATAAGVATAQDVVDGLKDGLWEPTDEVRGPGDAGWRPIESHPAFADAAAELDDPAPPHADETHLDMNPLIDVCLVLLIFFMLTITVESLRRAIEVPPEQSDEKGTFVEVKRDDIKDRVFTVSGRMEGNDTVIRVEDKAFRLKSFLAPIPNEPPEEQLKRTQANEEQMEAVRKEIADVVKRTGRKEMIFDMDGQVAWGLQTAVLDAAKGSGVHDILRQMRKKK